MIGRRRRVSPACLVPALLALAVSPAWSAAAQDVVKRVGRVTLAVDAARGRPGGFLIVRASGVAPGAMSAILDGRRVPFLSSARGAWALVPIAVDAEPGPATLGIEVRTRRGGRQRVPLDVTIAPRSYSPRAVALPEAKRALLTRPEVPREGRRVLQALRAVSAAALWSGAFQPPVAGGRELGYGFGGLQSYVGLSTPVEARTDSVFGEYHRGLDYDVARGTPVVAPAAGRVLMANLLTLNGWTVLLDHGQGLISAFFHLDALGVVEGQELGAGASLGRAGDSGLTAFQHVHWGVYLHGVAIDPELLLASGLE